MPVLIQSRSFIGVKQAMLNKIFLHNFPSFFGRCSVYGTPAIARVSGFVPYMELPPFEG